jgi:hypothetical protein
MATTTTPIFYNTTSGFTLSDSNKIQILASTANLINNSGYSEANPNILSSFQMQASALSAFSETASYSGSDNVQYTILINGADYYWNGSGWVTSNGTYSQSNTASVINSNCGSSSLATILGTGSYVQIRAFLHSASGTTTPTLTSIAVTYTFAAIRPSNPAQCTVWVYLEDILGNIVGSVQNASLGVSQKDPFIYGQFVVAPFTKSVAFNSSGYAQIILDETQTPGYSVQFSITYQTNSTIKQISFIPCVVPNAGACALTSITTFENKTATVTPITGNNSITPVETQVVISNNVTSIPIASLNFSPATFSEVEIWLNIRRQTSNNFFRFIGRAYLTWSQTTSLWSLTLIGDTGSSGPITGVSLAVSTGAGPYYLPTISYTSDDATNSGAYTNYIGTMRYKIMNTFLLEQ